MPIAAGENQTVCNYVKCHCQGNMIAHLNKMALRAHEDATVERVSPLSQHVWRKMTLAFCFFSKASLFASVTLPLVWTLTLAEVIISLLNAMIETFRTIQSSCET